MLEIIQEAKRVKTGSFLSYFPPFVPINTKLGFAKIMLFLLSSGLFCKQVIIRGLFQTSYFMGRQPQLMSRLELTELAFLLSFMSWFHSTFCIFVVLLD